jgi:predicted ferric reductase
MAPTTTAPELKKKRQGMAGGIILLLIPAGILCGASLPFFFESQSLWYKFGIEKTMLQWGKAAGFAAIVLIVCQGLWTAGPNALTALVSVKRRYTIHRICGILLAVLILLHPLLILWSAGFTPIPLELRYWPEYLGIVSAVLILITAAVSLRRAKLQLSHKTWQRLHRWAAPVITILALIHAPAVSETFGFMVPRVWLGMIILAALVLFTRLYLNRLTRRKK